MIRGRLENASDTSNSGNRRGHAKHLFPAFWGACRVLRTPRLGGCPQVHNLIVAQDVSQNSSALTPYLPVPLELRTKIGLPPPASSRYHTSLLNRAFYTELRRRMSPYLCTKAQMGLRVRTYKFWRGEWFLQHQSGHLVCPEERF
mmetsp:Transcript_23507/g.54611  ORF Transcript_23507/g.54611 Transcript_23507/m.54611 type:complete len:145 (+) Transcript_23507:590-1024(+)